MTDKMFTVGKIINTHGIKGEVKVLRITDFEERFEIGNTLYIIRANDDPLTVTITGHRMHKGYDLLQFKGFTDINDVVGFKGLELKITEKQLTELGETEFYYHQIIGCKVYTQEDKEIGTIKEILSPGANDVWVVGRHSRKDVYIPYITDVVKEVDVQSQKVMIEPMEGLLD
ncbi:MULTISPECIES: ribosome maturation factor RimM [Virgibacillus]|uniref:Ribosome maturation factor RimM n=2 Tax=Virgibacillus TaxID=84406 RepID=A0A024QC77_9BACI|nr:MULTISPECIES: ribosome maturation factor RimM [Virgibacillus]EQB36440.1 hypothetical protein M948_15525 [Virgibacillus sp. CM-4]MYL42273.1 ribosome maturation factor RimM [Virgibacillus massiliensis]GGJ43862.1 ribosome maturation factor RimM [Virgibacillus kapii]CDQ40138.1 Ribosome maturation factor RimM [Virgibacillus massiliensis]